MDYVTAPEVLRALVRMIEADVIPALGDDYLRSQLWAATGLLGNIANDLERPAHAVPRGSVGVDLAGFLGTSMLERALKDGEGAADAAVLVRENLDSVIRGHATLHYRRAVAGFAEAE
jgi:hypothetical protein